MASSACSPPSTFPSRSTAGELTSNKLREVLIALVHVRNLSISMAAGNATIWKPSPTTSLCSIAVTKIVAGVLERNGLPGAIASLVTGGKDVGEGVAESRDVDMGQCAFMVASVRLMFCFATSCAI